MLITVAVMALRIVTRRGAARGLIRMQMDEGLDAGTCALREEIRVYDARRGVFERWNIGLEEGG